MSALAITIYLSDVTLAAACVLGVGRYRRLETERQYLVWLSLLAAAMTVASAVLNHYQHSNLVLAPIDAAIEFTLLALMYRRVLWPSAVARYLPVVMGAFLVGTAFSFWLSIGKVEFSPVQHFIESLLVLGLVGLYFRRLLAGPTTLAPLEREPMFWVSAGLLLYFAGNALIFLSSNVVLHLSRELSRNIWAIHGLLYCFLNGFYVVALWVDPWTGPGLPPARVTQS